MSLSISFNMSTNRYERKLQDSKFSATLCTSKELPGKRWVNPSQISRDSADPWRHRGLSGSPVSLSTAYGIVSRHLQHSSILAIVWKTSVANSAILLHQSEHLPQLRIDLRVPAFELIDGLSGLVLTGLRLSHIARGTESLTIAKQHVPIRAIIGSLDL
jgi:hypothetical protein